MDLTEIAAKREALAAAFAAEPAVLAGWLFGSVARGRAGVLSDVDFAVLLRGDAPRGMDRLVLLDRIAERAGRILGLPGEQVDVVALEDQPTTFQHSVLRTGKLLYERDPAARRLFAWQAILRYLDFKPTLDIYDRARYGTRRA